MQDSKHGHRTDGYQYVSRPANAQTDIYTNVKYFTSSILRIQFLMLSKDFSLVMSYTNMMPWGV